MQHPVEPTILHTESREAAAQLRHLLETHSVFSFLRLGDGELRLLLQHQHTEEADAGPTLRASCEIAYGDPGLSPEYYARLLHSYEQCSFVDLYGELPYNRSHLGRLHWNRTSSLLGAASSGGVGLIFTWVYYELRSYLQHHRTVICGAEASLLQELLTEPRYREIASSLWPADAQVAFLQPRRNGAHLAADLDLIKDDLRQTIRAHRADTVFLSLGGAAKILCHELAEEEGIRAIDFGSALRALTYAGSDGYASWRASHHPFLIRVPFDLFMAALQRSRPDLDTATLISKAHAQLCLELQTKELLRSNTSDVNNSSMFNPSAENLTHFRESFSRYRQLIVRVGADDPQVQDLIREFQKWRWKKGLGWDGKLFRMAVAGKGLLRRAGLVK